MTVDTTGLQIKSIARYDYAGAPVLSAFGASRSFIQGVMGPFGSGKSVSCLVKILRLSRQQKPGPDGIRRTRWPVVRNTYRQLEDTTIKTVKEWLPPHTWGTYLSQKHDYTITGIKGCVIELMFRALDRPDHLKNLLSLEATGAWVNEAREVPRAIIDGLTGRVGRYPRVIDGGCSWFGLIMDTNPPDDESWWFDLFENMNLPEGENDFEIRCPQCMCAFMVGEHRGQCPECGLKYAELFKQPSGLSDKAENIRYLPPNYYQNLCVGKEQDWIQVYVKGLYGVVREGKPVFPSYNDNIHCAPVTFNPRLPVIRGWDFGLTPACVFLQVPPLGQVKVKYELCAERAGAERFSDEVLRFCSEKLKGVTEYYDVGDPAGVAASQTDERSCFDILRGKGISIQPGHVGLEMRLEAVRYALNTLVDGKPGIIIDPECKRLRKGFIGRYQYRRKMTSREEYFEEPDKNEFSHIQDALQYPMSVLFADILKGRQKQVLQQVENDYWEETRQLRDRVNPHTGY